MNRKPRSTIPHPGVSFKIYAEEWDVVALVSVYDRHNNRSSYAITRPPITEPDQRRKGFHIQAAEAIGPGTSTWEPTLREAHLYAQRLCRESLRRKQINRVTVNATARILQNLP